MRDYILDEYELLLKVVTEIFGDYRKADEWMLSQNSSLFGETPASLIISGRSDVLRKLIFSMAEKYRENENAA